MSTFAQAEIYAATLSPTVYETGGAHGQKGVDFQRYWAISRIIELVDSEQPDFLLLFESLQDVVEFDHPSNPTSATVYQVKGKGTGEWTWNALTALPISIPRKKRNSTELTTPKLFTDSAIGKLAATVAELPNLAAEGVFVSNLGSTAPLEKGSVAGSVQLCKFSELSKDLQAQIKPELAKLKKTITLDKLHLRRTPISLDDPDAHVLGRVAGYLKKAAPRHVNQCQSFRDSLFVVLSARGRKTDAPDAFTKLVKQRGYTRSDFDLALDELRSVPDRQGLIKNWLNRLLTLEEMPIQPHTKLQIEVTRRLEIRLRGAATKNSDIVEAARKWIESNPPDKDILPFLEGGVAELSVTFPNAPLQILQAILIIEGIEQCLSPTLEF
jgi:hypothetical protein